MKKLTAEKCRNLIGYMNAEWDESGLSDNEQLYLQALEIALPVLEQQELSDGWIEWSGGDCPVPESEIVAFRCRDGYYHTLTASEISWFHDGERDDIIAYRIIPEQPTNQNGEQWIKCSERIPEGEASGWILVYLANGNIEMALYDVFDGFTDGDLYSFCSAVTHWQSLPSPPEEA